MSTTKNPVHIGVCHAHANCTDRPHHGPCGCPDCNKPHPPHFQNSYCENLSSASVVEGDEVNEDDRTTGENGNNVAGQTGSSRFSWIIVAAAATACAAIGAAVMRKRVRILMNARHSNTNFQFCLLTYTLRVLTER